jgi:hypothetical protein
MCFFAVVVYRVLDCFYIVDVALSGEFSEKVFADWCSERFPAWKKSIGLCNSYEREKYLPCRMAALRRIMVDGSWLSSDLDMELFEVEADVALAKNRTIPLWGMAGT